MSEDRREIAEMYQVPFVPHARLHRSPRVHDVVRSGLDLASGPWQNRDKTPHVELTRVAFERKADSPSC